MIDLSESRLQPFRHQAEDAERLVDSRFLFITSEMRTGKTKIVIDAMQFLFKEQVIDTVIVIAPGPVRGVWYDQSIGELQKHLWLSTPADIYEFHSTPRSWTWPLTGPRPPRRMTWIITNYEFLRSAIHLRVLLKYAGPRAFVVMDESSYVKNHSAIQTKNASHIRWASARVTLLNGTPISHSPKDLFSQGNILHPSILQCQYITKYMGTYAEMAPIIVTGGLKLTSNRGIDILKVARWKPEGLADLQRRFAPYTIRRLQRECLDLPPKLDPVTITATMKPKTWSMYRAMRDHMVTWLTTTTVATASQAAVKSLRLSQILSGFLGGIENAFAPTSAHVDVPVWMQPDLEPEGAPYIETPGSGDEFQEVGREKLDVLLWFLEHQFEQEDAPHIVTWCRFRPELYRMMRTVGEKFPAFSCGQIVGAQKKDDRIRAMRLLHPDTAPKSPVFVGGTFGTGSFGLNFTAANISINMSFDYSLGKFLQSQDRVYGPGQTSPVAYFDIVAVGPNGQRTIDHTILEARKNNEDIATWTASAWIKELTRE